MTGISKLVLKNIRSHLDTVIEFDPHFNVIAGESDRGKSVVFWAINCVLFNPRGWNPRPWKRLKPKGASRIELHFFDGTIVARVWDKGKNTYELNGESLSGLHGTVPDQVKAALNMTDANVHPQKDMFFLLNETSGKVAREINRVTNLEVMDKALALAKSRMQETKKTITGLEVLNKDWLEEIKLKKPILKVKEVLNTLGKREIILNERRERIIDIDAAVDTCVNLQETLTALPSDNCVEDLAQLTKDHTRLHELKKKVSAASKAIERIQNLQEELEGSEDLNHALGVLQALTKRDQDFDERAIIVSRTQKLCAQYIKAERSVSLAIPDECVEDLEELNSIAATLQSTQERLSAVNTMVLSIDGMLVGVDQLQDGITIDQEELDELRGGMTICPTCLTHLNA